MDISTKFMADYIDDKGIFIKKLCKSAELSYTSIYNSLRRTNRPLRADELLILCDFLEIDPNVIKKKVIKER